MKRPAARAATTLALVLTSCAPALREPPTAARIGAGLADAPGPAASPADVDGLLAEAEAAFARRPDPASLRASQRAFLAAARADESRIEGLIGLARVSSWRVEAEADPEERDRNVAAALEAAQACEARAPGRAACAYALAQALGQQARERPSTSRDGLQHMLQALERASAAEPDLDHAGPYRVLALVRLRAPGWPLGPGDAALGLAAAEAAVARAPEHPANQLALGEALARNGRGPEARAAYDRALALARARAADGDPDAPAWVGEAERGRR